jgi:UDP-glucose 4-epimerase
MKILVTGGAGYIGSTVAFALQEAGAEAVVLDDLSRGSADLLPHFTSYVGDIADAALLDQIFTEHPDIDAAIHCAARTVVTESLDSPITHYRENVGKTVELVAQLLRHGCDRLIFSSTAAVYGTTPDILITEDTPAQPANPYGMSKLIVERMLADVCAAGPLTALSLRYFNPIGSDPHHRTGPCDPAPDDVVSTLLAASDSGEPFWIHGRDWPTADGTPVRDFVHVWDLALAHVAALDHWSTITRHARHQVINIGSGRGTTIQQLADDFNCVATRPVKVRYDGRRRGDIAGGFADASKAESKLAWRATRTVAEGLHDAMRWAKRQPAEVVP